MISPNQFRRFALLVSLLTVLAGCADQHEESEVQLPDWLSETEGDSTTAEAASADSPPSPTGVAPGEMAGGASAAVHRTSGQAPLQSGERIPLRKVIEQELQQSSLDGQPQISRSRLELLLTITIADRRDGHTLMQVQYDRVNYTQDVAGERIEYDSTRPQQPIPPAVLAYHGMVGDGFAFWLGPDNQIAQVVGFREFIERCMAHVPPEQRQQALLALQGSAGDQEVADFVDSTIGLLPPEGQQPAAGRWEQTQHISQPVPMQINTVYTLTGMDDSVAEVMVGGSVVPSTALGASEPSPELQITVNGGSSSGQCTIDRRTGLPRHSQLERIVDMTVRMASGIEFAQQKRTVTTVEALSQQRLAASDTRPQFR